MIQLEARRSCISDRSTLVEMTNAVTSDSDGMVLGLPRYVVTFLRHMESHKDHLKWNISEGSHKLTLTLTWNFRPAAASSASKKSKQASLWDRLQRTLRLGRFASDRSVRHGYSGGGAGGVGSGGGSASIPHDLSRFLGESSDERHPLESSISQPVPLSVCGAWSPFGDGTAKQYHQLLQQQQQQLLQQQQQQQHQRRHWSQYSSQSLPARIAPAGGELTAAAAASGGGIGRGGGGGGMGAGGAGGGGGGSAVVLLQNQVPTPAGSHRNSNHSHQAPPTIGNSSGSVGAGGGCFSTSYGNLPSVRRYGGGCGVVVGGGGSRGVEAHRGEVSPSHFSWPGASFDNLSTSEPVEHSTPTANMTPLSAPSSTSINRIGSVSNRGGVGGENSIISGRTEYEDDDDDDDEDLLDDEVAEEGNNSESTTAGPTRLTSENDADEWNQMLTGGSRWPRFYLDGTESLPPSEDGHVTPSQDDVQQRHDDDVMTTPTTDGSRPSPPSVNQTVMKCLDSCDKILFRHSTTIT